MARNYSIKPGQPWYDTEGKRIQAHGGSMLFRDDTFYWYGENKEGVTDEKLLWHNGVRMYSSKDLYNWKDEGVVCATHPEDRESPLHPYSKMDRPHILYNDKTKKFVLWMKIMCEGGLEQYMATATADKITGPYRIVNEKLHPGGMNSGDFDLVKREDGSACIVFERVHSDMIVMDLTDDYLDTTLTYSVHLPRKCPPYVREAPAVFHRNGKHYIITSGTTAKFPNASETVSYDDIHGEWEELGDPFVGDVKRTSFDSQVSCVFKYRDGGQMARRSSRGQTRYRRNFCRDLRSGCEIRPCGFSPLFADRKEYLSCGLRMAPREVCRRRAEDQMARRMDD